MLDKYHFNDRYVYMKDLFEYSTPELVRMDIEAGEPITDVN